VKDFQCDVMPKEGNVKIKHVEKIILLGCSNIWPSVLWHSAFLSLCKLKKLKKATQELRSHFGRFEKLASYKGKLKKQIFLQPLLLVIVFKVGSMNRSH
jgi:hypothetical protein